MHLSRTQWQLLSTAIVIGVLAVLGWQWLNQPASYTVAASPAASSSGFTTVIVDVAGFVRHPGIVELPLGSRVNDAITAAGGVLPHHRAEVNLARVLVDGEQIYVGQEVSNSGGGKLNINRASASAIEQLPGVGPVLAQRIVDYRTSHGSFKRVEDLDNVSGVGPAMMSKLKPLVTIG
ncbi:MAG: hypothetical protein RIS43_1031 [Actinomycetota bacterium]